MRCPARPQLQVPAYRFLHLKRTHRFFSSSICPRRPPARAATQHISDLADADQLCNPTSPIQSLINMINVAQIAPAATTKNCLCTENAQEQPHAEADHLHPQETNASASLGAALRFDRIPVSRLSITTMIRARRGSNGRLDYRLRPPASGWSESIPLRFLDAGCGNAPRRRSAGVPGTPIVNAGHP